MSNIKAVRKTMYRCTVCGKEYDDRKEAEKRCGSYKLEPPVFKVGDEVTVDIGRSGCTNYVHSKVTKIIGPVVGNSCRDGKRRYGTGAHVYLYRLKQRPEQGYGRLAFDFWTSELEKS